MCVDRDGRQTFDRCHVAQMFAETRFVDCKIVIEWQQNGRDHAVGNMSRVPGHSPPSSSDRCCHARFEA